MIQVYMYDAVIAEFPLDTYYADPSGGNLNIRVLVGDEIFERFEDGEWTDVRW
jgi:hypothetical protein